MIWSYSFLSNFDRCPKQAEARYISKSLSYVETEEAVRGTQAHRLIDARLKGESNALPIEYEKYIDWVLRFSRSPLTEHAIGVTRDWRPVDFYSSDVWGRGKLDCAIVFGNNAIIIDWKTGKSREDPFELYLQALLLNSIYPTLKVIHGFYIWLKEDYFGRIYDLSETDCMRQWVEWRMAEIDQSRWPAKRNPLCKWCTLSVCEYCQAV
jgi:hypothetical protein